MYNIYTSNFTPRLSVNASLHRYDFNKWNLWTVIKLLLQRTNFRNICKAIRRNYTRQTLFEFPIK